MKTIINMPRNYLEKITELYVFVSIDEGGEGMISRSFEIEGQTIMMPFVCADKARMESLKPLALEMGAMGNRTIRLIKLTDRQELEIIYQAQKRN